jgi:hypothetical protein
MSAAWRRVAFCLLLTAIRILSFASRQSSNFREDLPEWNAPIAGPTRHPAGADKTLYASNDYKRNGAAGARTCRVGGPPLWHPNISWAAPGPRQFLVHNVLGSQEYTLQSWRDSPATQLGLGLWWAFIALIALIAAGAAALAWCLQHAPCLVEVWLHAEHTFPVLPCPLQLLVVAPAACIRLISIMARGYVEWHEAARTVLLVWCLLQHMPRPWLWQHGSRPSMLVTAGAGMQLAIPWTWLCTCVQQAACTLMAAMKSVASMPEPTCSCVLGLAILCWAATQWRRLSSLPSDLHALW